MSQCIMFMIIFVKCLQQANSFDDVLIESLNNKIDSVKNVLEFDMHLLRKKMDRLTVSLEGLEETSRIGIPAGTILSSESEEPDGQREENRGLLNNYSSLLHDVKVLRKAFRTEKGRCVNIRNTFDTFLAQTDLRNEELSSSMSNIEEKVTAIVQENERLRGNLIEQANQIDTFQNKIRTISLANEDAHATLTHFRNITTSRIEETLDTINSTLYTYAEKISQLQPTEELYETMSGNLVQMMGPLLKWLNKTAALKGLASSCTKDTDCWVDNSECREGSCRCVYGRSYDNVQWKCVNTCTHYGTTFQSVDGYYIVGNNDAILKQIDLVECRRQCLSATSFLCRTIDYFKNERECYLQSATKDTVPGQKWRASHVPVVHLQRDCS